MQGRQCDNCDFAKASILCEDCHMYLCSSSDKGSNSCNENIHMPRKLRAHLRTQVGNPTKEFVEIFLGGRHLPKLDPYSECDPLVTLSLQDPKTEAIRYLDRTEMIEDVNEPTFEKVFVLNYHKDTTPNEVIRFDIYDADVENHPSAFHFPSEKDRIGEVVLRLNDVLTLQNGKPAPRTAAPLTPYEKDQNRYYFRLSNEINPEREKMCKDMDAQLWVEAYLIVGEDAGKRKLAREKAKQASKERRTVKVTDPDELMTDEKTSDVKSPTTPRDEDDDESKGMIHYVHSFYSFDPDVLDHLTDKQRNHPLSSTLKHMMGRIQNAEYQIQAVKMSQQASQRPGSSGGNLATPTAASREVRFAFGQPTSTTQRPQSPAQPVSSMDLLARFERMEREMKTLQSTNEVLVRRVEDLERQSSKTGAATQSSNINILSARSVASTPGSTSSAYTKAAFAPPDILKIRPGTADRPRTSPHGDWFN